MYFFINSFRLSWFLYGEPKSQKLHDLRKENLASLSSQQKEILRELQAYLHYWKTEGQKENPFRTFFHIIDQLTFELAVQGFMRKSDAMVIRDFMLDLVSTGYSVPEFDSNFAKS